MILPKFKEFLVLKTVRAIFNEPISGIESQLYSNDSQISSLDGNGTISKIWHKDHITEDMVSQEKISLEIKFSTISFNKGLSLKALKSISVAFATEQIFVSGDGHDFQMGEFTSDHDSEIILRVEPENNRQLLSEYRQWLSILKQESDKKLSSVKPK